MRIGIISTIGDCSWAGSEEMWKLFAVEALRHGQHSVAAMLQTPIAQSKELTDFRTLGGRVFAYNPLNRYTSRTVRVGYSRFRQLEQWKPDIICVSGHPAIPYRDRDLYRLLNAHKGPRVFIVQGNADWFIAGQAERDALRALYNSARRIICVSRNNAQLLQRQLTSRLPITILPNPIRSRLEQPLPWPADSQQTRFATVGRYETFGKCQDTVLEALATPEWKKRNWQLDLFGSGSDAKYIQDVVSYLGLEDRVRLCGYEREFTKIWTDHHLHILISRGEGLALALIESMFCGRPAVVSRTGGNHELLRQGQDGFVSAGEDPAIVREILEQAWRNRERWAGMGKAAFERVNEWIPRDLSLSLLRTICDSSSPEP